MTKLTFKEYVETKNQLLEALKQDPMAVQHYRLKKHTRLLADNEGINLRPFDKVQMIWRYDRETMVPQQYESVIVNDKPIEISWAHTKMLTWLKNHCVEHISHA